MTASTAQRNKLPRLITVTCFKPLCGMFRCSASLAIPHRKMFAVILSVSLVHLGHTNRNVSVLHESQREIALVEAFSRMIPDYQEGEVGERHGPLFRNVSQAVLTAQFESVSESQPNRTIQCHYVSNQHTEINFR